jgi:hypothetical protein
MWGKHKRGSEKLRATGWSLAQGRAGVATGRGEQVARLAHRRVDGGSSAGWALSLVQSHGGSYCLNGPAQNKYPKAFQISQTDLNLQNKKRVFIEIHKSLNFTW